MDSNMSTVVAELTALYVVIWLSLKVCQSPNAKVVPILASLKTIVN